MKKIIFIIFFIFSSNAFSNNCAKHSKNDPSVPLCPKGGGVLPETYPVKMALVSTDMINGTESDASSRKAQNFIYELFKAQENLPPAIVLSAFNQNECESIIKGIKTRAITDNAIADNKKEELASEWASNISCNIKSNWTWQQDFAQSYVNSKGTPVVRFNSQYDRNNGKNYRGIKPHIRKCGFLVNEMGLGSGNASMGGNIEAIPPDICVVGDSIDDEKININSLCSNVHKIKAPTEFMEVGHVDEIMKTIETNDPKPCNFKVLVGDISLGRRLLLNSKLKEEFIPNPSQQQSDICEIGRSINPERSSGDYPTNSIDGSNINYLDFIKQFFPAVFLPKANANLSVDGGSKTFSSPEDKSCWPKDFYEGLMSEHKEGNSKEKELNDFAHKVNSAISRRLPGCSNSVLRVPMLFYGRHVDDAISTFPNPTNGVSINSHFIFPEQNNTIFQNYLNEMTSKLSIKSSTIDTRSLHKRKGNLHCASNLLRYCRPRPN